MADELFEALMTQATQTEETPNTEMVQEQTNVAEQTTEQIPTETSTEMVETQTETTVETTDALTTTQEVDYNGWLQQQTDGLFKSTDDLKASLEKVKGYDEKVAKLGELEKNQLPDDAFVKTLVDMRSKGASKDQITEFIKLNTEYEDFDAMSPEQRMVAKLVLVDGYSKDVAERKIAREYNLSEYDEDSEEYKDIKEEQRIASRKDLEALNAYRAKVTTVENQEEQRQLEGIALKAAHEQNVKQTIPTFLDKFAGLGGIKLDGKIGEEEISKELNFEFDNEYKQTIPQKLENFFNSEIAPITQEKVDEAMDYIKAEYLLNNWQNIAKNIFSTALALGAEKQDNRYVNNNGVTEVSKETADKQGISSAEWDAFANKLWK